MQKEDGLERFWDNREYFTENHVKEVLTDEMISFTEKKLGYKLPKSYIELIKIQNGENE